MAAERERGFEDQTQLFYQLVTGSRTSLDELDRLFEGGQSEQVRAYALAGALVHDVFERHGPAGCAQILARVGRGAPFDGAFAYYEAPPLYLARGWQPPGPNETP